MTSARFPHRDDNSLTMLLQIKREQKGWSIEQASMKTGIPVRYLEDIENNTFRIFIGKAAVLEGYLRVYTNRLGIDYQTQKAILDHAKNVLLPGKFNF
jgi:cytoskeletal protein RodZ